MTTDLVATEKPRQLSILDMNPPEKVVAVSHLATILTDIIDKQKLYTVIQGKKHVRVEGWATIGSFLGVYPREKGVQALDDGSYIAEVELVRGDTGLVIGGASSLCSVQEKRWAGADAYARRSMAVTRATGKAFRLSFAWIAAMSGYEACPAEEMPETIKVDAKTVEVYSGTPTELSALKGYLTNQGVHVDKHDAISDAMLGRPKADIATVIKEHKA